MHLSAKIARSHIYALCRLVLGVIFVYAASVKIDAPQELADSIASYDVVPYPIISLMALALPLFELACGLLMLTGYSCATGLLSSITMLCLFLAALLSAVVRGLPINCGCFGAHSWLDANPWMALVRDSVLLLCALYAYRHCIELKLRQRNRDEARMSRVAR